MFRNCIQCLKRNSPKSNDKPRIHYIYRACQ